jgi:hypothetical protein
MGSAANICFAKLASGYDFEYPSVSRLCCLCMLRKRTSRRKDYFQQAMRDLARLDRGALAPREAQEGRERTETELGRRLKQEQSVGNVRKVLALVFECGSPEAKTFFSVVLTFFNRSVETVEQELLFLIEDAWDYFPHRCLQGHWPAELDTMLFRDELVKP